MGAGDPTKCKWCHTANAAGVVTSFANGLFHPALVDAGITLAAGALCDDCHAQMRPVAVVEHGGSALLPIDHSAAFTAPVLINGTSVTTVAQIDCTVCHKQPGITWTDGTFHKNISTGVPADCTVCHYPGMVTASADVSNGTQWAMKHRSAQLTFQNCQTCHKQSLANGAVTPSTWTLWQTSDLTGMGPGNMLHSAMSPEPGKCVDCHAVSEPAANASTQSSVTYALATGGTTSNGAQWMNHGASYVTGLDCVTCHSADDTASASAWSKADLFHPKVPSAATCDTCHGLANGGGSTPGTRDNLPSGLTNSITVSSAAGAASTGVPAGTLDQINHADINVTNAAECSLCHTQTGTSTTAGVQGKEWAQASFHKNFGAGNALLMNGTTGRCSNCHLNVKPTAAFTTFDHSTFTDVSGSADCATCHAFPGTGTAAAPNWLGAQGTPQYINVGGFTIPNPPASNTSTVEANIASLPHPTVPSGTACTTCHSSATVFKPAIAYDHASPLIDGNCSSCHEDGSNLVSVPYNGASAELSGAGDTRPIQVSNLTVYHGRSCTLTVTNHFYPNNCYDCHTVSTNSVTGNTPGPGSSYLDSSGNGPWTFPHKQQTMRAECNICHGPCPGD